VPITHCLKRTLPLLVTLALALPLGAAKKDLVWVAATVESIAQQVNGSPGVPYDQRAAFRGEMVMESIYLDAGEWLYHVTRVTNPQSRLKLREGGRIEVAEDGKKLILRFGAKQYSTNVDQKSHAGKPKAPPASAH